ncbi:MAG: T9SS type A sorting domain-containing protein [Bacteroidia bacterium]|nr:T9SS type A sorting domain-containing protein [Bacteroidia bacterium]
MKRTIICAVFSCLMMIATSQNDSRSLWLEIAEDEIENNDRRYIVPENYKVYKLLLSDLIAYMSNCPDGEAYEVENSNFFISFPYPDGNMHTFSILETPVMHEDLQVQYPNIRTYTGIDIDDPSSYLKMDITVQGFHAMVRTTDGQVFIDPYSFGNTQHYISYYKRDLLKTPENHFVCEVTDAYHMPPSHGAGGLNTRAGDCKLRTYRAAIAATAEYTSFHGGTTAALAAINTTLNRVNSVYEVDLAISFNLISNNNLIVYSNASTDPYTNSSTFTMLSENTSNLSSVIGNSNFDIGHVFAVGGGGVASLGSVCGNSKARGVSSLGSPIGDPFDVDYVSHEIGHQFGGNHTQNASCNRVSNAAYEPGSGTTIMGYAGVCSPYNVQSNSDAMFHSNSIREMANFVTLGNGNSCPVKTILSNSPPVANAGANYTIPKSTPFVLEGTATDPDLDPLTYSWEQWDPEFAQVMPPASTNTLGPLFRTYLPEGPTRYFPDLDDIINNNSPTWNVLPSVGRSMEFRFIVRDNNPGAGCTDEDNMMVSVASNAGPFVVTSPNSSSVVWTGYQNKNVQWNIANTNASPVNTFNVDIYLSVNGGLSFPLFLGTFPNTGTANIVVPSISTNNARIMVKGNNNIFLDISDNDFVINPGVQTACITPANLNVTNIKATSAKLNWDVVSGADHYVIQGNEISSAGVVTLTIPNGAATSFNVGGLSGNNTYFWQIKAVCNSDGTVESNWSATNTFTTLDCRESNNIFTDNIESDKARLNWDSVPNAITYNIRGGIQGGGFVSLSITGSLSNYTVFNLSPSTTYVWQIRTNCGSGIRSGYSSFTQFTTPASTNKTMADSDYFNIYPNPSRGNLTIDIKDAVHANSRVHIMNSQSKLLMDFNNVNKGDRLFIDLEKYSSGIYFIHLVSGDNSVVEKVMLIN